MIQLHALGAAGLRRDGTEVRAVLSQPKRLGLLVFLAVATPRGFHRRDTLLGLFWPELDQERARSALRQALHHLRRAVGEEVIVGRGDREIGIDPAHLWCDVVAFDQAVSEGRHEDALTLYRGDLLPGFYIEEAPDAERWLEEERAARRRQAVDAAWALAAREESAGELRAAALWARRASALDPLDEGSLRRLLTILEKGDESAAALEVYADFARRLDAEYGVAPSAATADLVDGIRNRPRPVAPARTTVPRSAPAVVSAPAGSPTKRPAETPAETPAGSPAEGTGAITVATAAPIVTVPRSVDRRRAWLIAGAGALLLAVAAGTWAWRVSGRDDVRQSPTTAPTTVPSIAVLPFVNLSGDPGKEYFSDGLSEELLNVLAQLPELRVASRTSSFRFRGNEVPVDSIGTLLRVGHVLEGSVREDGGRVRITAQLIDTRTGYHLWSQTYDRSVRDLFAVQDEISRAIVSALRVKLTSRASGSLVSRETNDPEAHALVLKGSHVFRTTDRESFAKAADFFTQAIARDSTYARAYAGLAAVLQQQAYRRYIPVDAGYARARAMAERALALDPAQIRAHSVIARIAEIHSWDFAAAEEHYRRAAELNPGSTAYIGPRAFLLVRLGRTDEAIAAAREYIKAEPAHAGGHANLGAIYGYAHRFEQSLDAFRTALELAPDNPSATLGIALTSSYLGRHADAVRVIDEARRSRPDDQYVLAAAGFIFAKAGRAADAAACLQQLRAQPDASYYLQATVLAGMGRRDEAFAALARAVERREDAVPDLGIDPSLDGMRDDPRMVALMVRAGLPTISAGR